jgi:hypothetical protein
MTIYKKTCDECQTPFTAKKREARFCCSPCRKAYNNRRAVRGAELYDLMMCCRYDRDYAYKIKLPSLLARRCSEWNCEDKRKGVRSWQRPMDWVRDNASRLRAIVMTIR